MLKPCKEEIADYLKEKKTSIQKLKTSPPRWEIAKNMSYSDWRANTVMWAKYCKLNGIGDIHQKYQSKGI